MGQWATRSLRYFELQIEFQKVTFFCTNELNCPPFTQVWNKTIPTGNPTIYPLISKHFKTEKPALKVEASMAKGSNKATNEVKYYPMDRHADRHSLCSYPTGENFW